MRHSKGYGIVPGIVMASKLESYAVNVTLSHTLNSTLIDPDARDCELYGSVVLLRLAASRTILQDPTWCPESAHMLSLKALCLTNFAFIWNSSH